MMLDWSATKQASPSLRALVNAAAAGGSKGGGGGPAGAGAAGDEMSATAISSGN